MIRSLVLQADQLQAELIVSDIPHTGRAFLRGFTRIRQAGAESAAEPGADARAAAPTAETTATAAPAAGRALTPADPAAELDGLMTTARRLAGSLGAKTLLAGFRPEGPLPLPDPGSPPAGLLPYTSFVRLTADPRQLAETERPDGVPAAPEPTIRRVPLTEARIGEFLILHRDGMAGVPNVPFLTEGDVLAMMTENRIELIELADGTAVGFVQVCLDETAGTADLDEIAVLPGWRGLGIGRRVITAVAGELAAAGIQALSLIVATSNTGALRLYETLGFGGSTLFAHWFQMPLEQPKPVAPMHTAAALAADLTRLGVRRGDVLMVHSALGSLGWVPGGAVALIDALTEAVGPEGTLVMPAHCGENSEPANWIAPPVPSDWWPAIRENVPPYRPESTPTSRIGTVPELFRTQPGVRRSAHPSCSFAARGPRAAEIVAEHRLEDALGSSSPGSRLVEMGARILQIGTDYDTCTLMHLGESQAACRMHIRQGAAMIVDGERRWMPYCDEHGNSDEFFGPGKLMESRAPVLTGKVGEAGCRLFSAADAVAAARDWFLENRMHRLGEADRGWLMQLLRREPEYNLFLIGDVENYGFSEPFQDILAYGRKGPDGRRTWPPPDMGSRTPAPATAPDSASPVSPAISEDPASPASPAIDSIVLRYYTNFIVYSESDTFALEPVLSALDYPPLSMLSAKKNVMDRLRPHLAGYRFSETFMMKRPITAPAAAESRAGGPASAATAARTAEAAPACEPIAQPGGSKPEALPVELARLGDVPELAAFLHSITEFAVANQTLSDRTDTLRRSLQNTGTRYVLIREDGRIVACAGTTAENSQSAMVISVATAPDCRRRGFATRLVSRLCDLHAREGREFLCLFYSNPAAGVIYRGLGFQEIGTWVMARPPVRLAGQGV